MKYSIIIPTLNEGKLLSDLLKSFSDEEIKKKFDFEIVVSDGGSNDNTLEIAKQYADKVIENNEGQKQNIAIGRNIGAHNSVGEILIFVNADVIIDDPVFFLERVTEFSQKKKYQAMTCNVKVFEEEENFTDWLFLSFYNRYFNLLNKVGIGMGRGECQVIRSAVFRDENGYNENYPAGEDFDLYRRIRKKGKIHFDNQLTVYESPRRYREQGHIRTMIRWSLNAVSVMFKKKAVSKEWEQVR